MNLAKYKELPNGSIRASFTLGFKLGKEALKRNRPECLEAAVRERSPGTFPKPCGRGFAC